MTSLPTLISRLEGGSGADRELDDALTEVLLGTPEDIQEASSEWGDWPPPLTISIDAALALVEAKLPGCGYTLSTTDDGQFYCELCRDGIVGYGPDEIARSLPRAILIALLRALSQEEKA